ncbi:hypothetical protein K788_00000670 [Paraburkholderia caribensis MBA4]|uniref:Uncharacterized protein n=1 Tax=Paraburkholderia caribensis MBA4 TaxID=1323664 RepID=A0A0P0RJJ0_9BURK|nr:hypothetical protein K788_00000670 [Paraburkholderia caribensis MBA4]
MRKGKKDLALSYLSKKGGKLRRRRSRHILKQRYLHLYLGKRTLHTPVETNFLISQESYLEEMRHGLFAQTKGRRVVKTRWVHLPLFQKTKLEERYSLLRTKFLQLEFA